MKTLHRRGGWLSDFLVASLWSAFRNLFAGLMFFICVCGVAQAQTHFSGTPQTIDNGVNDGGVGQYSSQAIVNGNPAVSYYDATNRNLKYVRADDAEGISWAMPVIVDSPGDVGQWTSLAVVDGKPAISYYDVTNTNLKYARALDENGATWGTPITVNPPGHAGFSSSLAVVDGKPAISYYDGLNRILKYVRATDAEGTSWGTPVIADAAENTGIYGSLEVVDGRPAIAYFRPTSGSLRYVRAADPEGAAWSAPVTVAPGAIVGWRPSLAVVNGNPAISYQNVSGLYLRYVRATSTDGSTWGGQVKIDVAKSGNTSSLAVVNGNPAISYVDATNHHLKYVRANDANGATAAAWGTRMTIDSDGSVGSYSSLVIADGKPVVSYWHSGNGDLKHIRATGANGTSWQTPVTVDVGSGGNVGQYTSLAIVDGNPAVSYYDSTQGLDLRYVRALDARGTDWDVPVLVDIAGSVGQFTSLKVVGGNPAISYYDVTNHNLKYVRALDPGGTTWGTPVTIDSGGDVGQYTSLEIVDGNPSIGYYDLTNGDLKYIRADSVDGATWGTLPVTIDSAGDVGQYASLEIVDGNPAIGYYDVTNLDLKYIRADSSNGATWGKPMAIDSTGDVGKYTSLEMVNGNPAIGYYESTGGNNLKYVRAVTSNGSTPADWGTPVTIDSGGSVGGYTSLAVVNGKPAISYYDSTASNLKYVRALTPQGSTLADWGTPLAIDTVGTIGQYTSLATVNCSTAVSYYNVTNGDLKYIRSNPIWNGELSADWHNGANWGFGCIPVSGESVVLPNSGVITEAVISNDDVTVADLALGTNRTVTVSGNRTLTVTGVLTMNGGNIIVAPGSRIVLGCNASVTGASSTDFIVGDVRKEFCDNESFIFPIGDITGTAEYSPMTVEITAGTFPPTALDPPSLTVSVTDTWLPGLDQSSSVSRYWTVSESGDLTADMTFTYLTADVNGIESSYKVFKRSVGFPTEVTPNSNNPAGNTATVTGVSSFSDWGVGLLAPTAASVSVSGRVLSAEGYGVSRASVSLTDQHGQTRATLSSNFGFYRFEDVQVGETYIFSVSSKRYQFTPQAVTVMDALQGLDFTAQP